MTLDVLLVLTVVTSLALGFLFGLQVGRVHGRRAAADQLDALQTLLDDLQNQRPALVLPGHPHVHSFTIEPQRTDGRWGYWSCYLCKAVQARELVGT